MNHHATPPPSTATITSLPSETLDAIIGHIESYDDILSFALSNKALYSVAVLRHLHYRDIRSRLHNPSLWSWLSRLDDLRAAHIHSLTILPDHKPDTYHFPMGMYGFRERLPPYFPSQNQPPDSLTLEATRESQMLLVSALKRMLRLRQFRWYCVPRPVLEGEDDIWNTLARLGTVQDLRVLDFQVNQFQVTPIAASNTFLRLGNLTILKLQTSVCCSSPNPESPEIPELEHMLLNNCINLEVLLLGLHFDEEYGGASANIEDLLMYVHWPKLRVLCLQGVNCRVPELERFLIAHPLIEELTLPPMMPGHAWTQLDIPGEALPKLKILHCSSFQVAALLKNSSTRPLRALHGVEVQEFIIDAQHFGWEDDWEDEHEEYDYYAVRLSPWKALFAECLKAQSSITSLGIASINAPEEMELLAVLAPQIIELEISMTIKISNTEWDRLISLFPALEIISAPVLFDSSYPEFTGTFDEFARLNARIQTLARSCTKLRVICAGYPEDRKLVIIREKGDGVRWVIREWEGSSDPHLVDDQEEVYGPVIVRDLSYYLDHTKLGMLSRLV